MHKLSAAEVESLVRGSADGSRLPKPNPDTASHQIHEYLHLAAALGASAKPLTPQVRITEPEIKEAIDNFLANRCTAQVPSPGNQPTLLLGLNPGAEYGPAKRWPPDRFAAVANSISARYPNSAWLLFGGPGDRPLCDEVARQLTGQSLNLAGQTSLRQLMALLRLCRVLLTNDTGPMHLAAALDTPVVVPFGSTSPELTGPGLPPDARHRLLKSSAPCSPCFRRDCPIDFRCMHSISVDHVQNALLDLLRTT